MQYLYVGVIYLLLLTITWMVFMRAKRKPLELDYQTAMGILDEGVKQIITQKYADYRLRDVTMPYDFQEEEAELTKKVMFLFTKDFLSVVEQYHPRDQIIRYVSAKMREFLIDYTDKYKIKTK